MDDIKDIQKSDTLAKLLDNPSVRTNPFGDNVIGERAYRRAERLVAALHLLTNHIPAEEPLRDSVRRISVQMLSEILQLRDEMRATNSARLSAVQASIRNLISLVKMLTVSGFISVQNAQVANEALDELGNFLNTSLRSSLSESVRLNKDDLLNVREMSVRVVRDVRDRVVKDTLTQRTVSEAVSIDRKMSHNGGRGEEILAVLRPGGEFGIRDIVSHLPEYSEKMIQRELAVLIKDGKVMKNGFKRWSKYSINNAR